MKNAVNILVRKRERRRPFWRYKLEDNIKMDLSEVIMCECRLDLCGSEYCSLAICCEQVISIAQKAGNVLIS
jgi:hypothetical protein